MIEPGQIITHTPDTASWPYKQYCKRLVMLIGLVTLIRFAAALLLPISTDLPTALFLLCLAASLAARNHAQLDIAHIGTSVLSVGLCVGLAFGNGSLALLPPAACTVALWLAIALVKPSFYVAASAALHVDGWSVPLHVQDVPCAECECPHLYVSAYEKPMLIAEPQQFVSQIGFRNGRRGRFIAVMRLFTDEHGRLWLAGKDQSLEETPA